jgi:hypothetical protein
MIYLYPSLALNFSLNAADFVHFVMPELAPASQNGQSRA